MANILDPLLSPLLQIPGFFAVSLLAILVSVIITVIYKYMTDQSLMKQLKEEMKELQKEMKELRNQPEKMMEVNKKAMQANSKYMMQSMKSTMITFIPIILIFGWMNANIAFEPIKPNQEFTVDALFSKPLQATLEVPTGVEILGNKTEQTSEEKGLFASSYKARWILRGVEGDYSGEKALKLVFGSDTEYKNLKITPKQAYYPMTEPFSGKSLRSITVNHEEKKVLNLGNFSILGFRGGWLGTYIIVSILVSSLLRKILKVY